MSPLCCVGSGGRQLLTRWVLMFLPPRKVIGGVILNPGALGNKPCPSLLVCLEAGWQAGLSPGLVLTGGNRCPEHCVEKDAQAGSRLSAQTSEQCLSCRQGRWRVRALYLLPWP